jgi:glycosyltransferase involved in cell wall biosynthesis
MHKKKVLVVCPGPIYPITMGSQIRMINIIKGLSQDHEVDVIARIPDRSHLSPEYVGKIMEICNEYYPILAPNKQNYFKRIYYRIKFGIVKFSSIPNDFFYFSILSLQKRIATVANSKRYDIIICEFWYSCSFYNRMLYKPYFVLDTIDVNFKKRELELKSRGKWESGYKKIQKYRELELKYTGLNDLIISVSEPDYHFFRENVSDKAHIKIPIGQDLSKFLQLKIRDYERNSILFYGSMSSFQNQEAFWILYNEIIPGIKKFKPGLQLNVVGSKPPKEIKALHDGKTIFIHGFVMDLTHAISKNALLILPLRSGGGFRTRIIEVMALGVPVIGTHNALNCIEMKSGIHGFITDSNSEMTEYAVRILNNPNLRKKMSEECIKFVSTKYSMEATYRKLSNYLIGLDGESG